MSLKMSGCLRFLLLLSIVRTGKLETLDDVELFLQAKRNTAGNGEQTDDKDSHHSDLGVGGCRSQESHQFPQEFVDMALRTRKPGDDFILRERKEQTKAKSHRHDALLKNRMAAVAKGDIMDESTGRKSTQVLPRHLLETFSEEEILDRAQIGGKTGPRYTLRELGITSLQDFMVPQEEEEMVEKWQVMLRASAGIKSVNLYELWISNETMNECNPKLASPDPNVKGVYKSALSMAWSKVHEVRVSIFNRGERVFQMTFDASRADRLSWFSPQWLTHHPYKDLGVEPLDVFSMKGITSSKSRQNYRWRFYASKNHALCGEDGDAWMVVVDAGSGFCERENNLDLPAFFYSGGLEAVNAKDLKRGDVFTIEGKIKYNPNALKRAEMEKNQKTKQQTP